MNNNTYPRPHVASTVDLAPVEALAVATERARNEGVRETKSRAPYVEVIARAIEAGYLEDAQRLMIQEASGRTATFGAPIGDMRPFLGKNRKERRAEAATARAKGGAK